MTREFPKDPLMPLDLNAVFTKRTDIAPGLSIFRVEPDGWELADFEPGQYAAIGLPGTAPRCEGADPEETLEKPEKIIRRAYSIASSSLAKKYLEFYVVLVESGALTPRLFAMEPGQKLWMGKKITGVFTLDSAPPDKNLVLISTGTGLAPYISMLRSSILETRAGKVAVLHGARHSWDLGYRDELTELAQTNGKFRYLPSITRPQMEKTPWEGVTGYIQNIWEEMPPSEILGFEPTPEDTHFYLCGNPSMIDTMVEKLEERGFKEHKKRDPGEIHLERYW